MPRSRRLFGRGHVTLWLCWPAPVGLRAQAHAHVRREAVNRRRTTPGNETITDPGEEVPRVGVGEAGSTENCVPSGSSTSAQRPLWRPALMLQHRGLGVTEALDLEQVVDRLDLYCDAGSRASASPAFPLRQLLAKQAGHRVWSRLQEGGWARATCSRTKPPRTFRRRQRRRRRRDSFPEVALVLAANDANGSLRLAAGRARRRGGVPGSPSRNQSAREPIAQPGNHDFPSQYARTPSSFSLIHQPVIPLSQLLASSVGPDFPLPPRARLGGKILTHGLFGGITRGRSACRSGRRSTAPMRTRTGIKPPTFFQDVRLDLTPFISVDSPSARSAMEHSYRLRFVR